MTKDFIEWLKELIRNNALEEFYKHPAWKKVSKEVKRIDNNECQPCKRAGKVTTPRKDARVQISAHHWMEVKQHPELALSIWYVDANGKTKRNIECVCETCHNKIHHKLCNADKKTFTNEERW